MKKDYFKLKACLEQNKSGGNSSAHIYFESNLVDVSPSSWWIDSSASVHIAMTLQVFKKIRKPNEIESKLKVGNNIKIEVESIRFVSFLLESIHGFVLKNIFVCSKF